MRDNIVYLKRPKRYSLEDAKDMLPTINTITKASLEEVDPLFKEAETFERLDKVPPVALTDKIQSIVDAWSDQMLCLGTFPKGLWFVDFDFGNGFYSWSYGEEDILYYHPYDKSFDQRLPLDENGEL